jgi:hypothetical protein
MKETSSITGNTVHAIAKRTAILDRVKRSKNRDRADLFEVVSFLCLNLGCIHSRLEFAQTDPMLRHQYTMSPSCGNACYFCNNQYKQMFRAVSYSGVRQYLAKLVQKGNVLLHKAIDILWKNKTLMEKVFRIKSANKYNVEGLFLQLLAGGIINCAVGADAFTDDADNDMDIKPDSLYVWVNFDANCEPFYNYPNSWHGINTIS